MITGRLQEKKGYWYCVLNLRKEDGTRYQKWFSTGLKAHGTKKLAEEKLIDLRREYTALEDLKKHAGKIDFSEYMYVWLANMKGRVAKSTYHGYRLLVKNSIAPYFAANPVTLLDLRPKHIE